MQSQTDERRRLTATARSTMRGERAGILGGQIQDESLPDGVLDCDVPDDALEAAAAPAGGVPTVMQHTYCFTCPA